MEINVMHRGLDVIRSQMSSLSKNMPREMAIAGKKTGKKARILIARKLATLIKQPMKVLKKSVYYKSSRNGVLIRVRKFLIAIKRFKPTQNKGGVQVAIRKGSFNPTTLRKQAVKESYPTGFMGPTPKTRAIKLNGHPFQRRGSARLPIRRIPAVSITATVESSGLVQIFGAEIKAEYQKQLIERVRFLTVKKERRLTWQKAKLNPT